MAADGKVSVAVPGGETKTFKANSATAPVLERLKELYGVGDLLDADGDSFVENDLCAGSYVYTPATPLPTALVGRSSLPPSDRVDELVMRFGVRLREARDVALERNKLRHDVTLPVDGLGNLVVPGADPGVFFPILGRDETLGKLVRGAAVVYQNFTQAASIVSEDQRVRCPHFNALIAYPGAGKSTIGTDFPYLLREFWKSGQAERCLASLGDCSGFVQMVKDSLELNYNACLYHNVDRHRGGLLYDVERELAAVGSYNQILALRLLFAATNQPGLDSGSYADLLDSLHPFVNQVTLNDVLAFFYKVMKPSHGRPIVLSLFLDEINAAEVVGTRGASWIQEVVSSYVRSLRETSTTNVFLIISLACTKHAAASLRLTASRQTPHVPIPVHPLRFDDCLAAVTGYFNRLALTLGRSDPEGFVASENLKLCVALTGGMPRYLGYMVRGMLTSVATDAIPAAGLLERAQKFTTDVLCRTLQNTIQLTQWKTYKYREGAGFAVLLGALRTSFLCSEVHRSQRVVPGSEETWGDLEQMGLVALQLMRTDPVVEPEDTPCRVLFPPLLALAMQDGRTDYFGTSFPSPLERGFRQRELKFVAFMIFLVKSPLQDPPRDFSLWDIIPKVWNMAKDLQLLRLPYPEQGRVEQVMTSEHVTGALLQALVVRLGSCFSLLASGNFGLDSVHVLGDFLIVTQTRSSDDAKDPPESGSRKRDSRREGPAGRPAKPDAARIVWSCLSDLVGVARLEHLTSQDLEEFLPAPEKLRSEVKRFCEELAYSPSTLEGMPPSSSGIQTRSSTRAGAKRVRYAEVDGGMDREVDVPAGVQGCYDLANIVYIYSADHLISESARSEIMNSKNPLCRRIIIRQADSSAAFDLLSKVRHLSTLTPVHYQPKT